MPAVALSEDQRTADLTLTVTPGPRVRVVFAGDPLPADRRADLVPVLREGSVDEDLLEDSSNRIEEYPQGRRATATRSAPHTRSRRGRRPVHHLRDPPRSAVPRVDAGVGGQHLAAGRGAAAAAPAARRPAVLRRAARGGPPAIEDVYHRRGFATARARAAVDVITATPPPAQVPVRIRLGIEEGPRTTVDCASASKATAPSPTARCGRGSRCRPGAPYVPSMVPVDRDAIQIAYQNAGYESTTVQPQPTFSDGRHAGDPSLRDPRRAAGVRRSRADRRQRADQHGDHRARAAAEAGRPLQPAAINESQRRLAALGLFRRARITELPHGSETKRDLLVTVEESPATTVGYGGGGELLRRARPGDDPERRPSSRSSSRRAPSSSSAAATCSARTDRSTCLRSVSQPTIGSDTSSDSTEYRVIGTFREPRVFDTAADAVLNGTLQRQIRSSFTYRLASASVEMVRRLTKSVGVSGVYQLQRTKLEDVSGDQPLIDRLFATVRLSSFTVSVLRDRRDDSVNPQSGRYLSASGQIAARAIGSEVGFAKAVLTAQTFHVLPRTHGVDFRRQRAARGRRRFSARCRGRRLTARP